jgi:serine/threonine protein kinase
MTIRTPGLPMSRKSGFHPTTISLSNPTVSYSSLADVGRASPAPPPPDAGTTRLPGTPAPPTIVIGSAAPTPAIQIGEGGGPQIVTITSSGGASSTSSVAPHARPNQAAGGPAVASSDPRASAAVRIGGYEVATRIARGGMGSVYVCRKAGGDHGRLLTLKVVREHTFNHELAAASFRHEALIGSLFRHPNAQTVIENGVYDDQPFLILEYLDGGSLADMLVEEMRPTPAIVVSIVLDVLTALHAMHQTVDPQGKALGLVHCDISPENVLVGVNGVARLADFGSARFTAVSNEMQPFAISKPPYMPPEQFRGDKLDSRSDLYSVGVLLYTALTGQQPFAADDYERTVINVMRKKIKPPSALGAPACLDDVCLQALNRSPDGRFVVAGAMAAALRTAAQAHDLVESREGVGQWVRRAMGDELARRHRLISSMFSGGGAPMTFGGTAAAAAPPVETRGAPAPMRATPAPMRATPAPTPLMGVPAVPVFVRTKTPALGLKAPPLRTRLMTGRRPRPVLSDRQQMIIALASVLAFAVTVTIGFAISGRSAPDAARAGVRGPASTALAAPGVAPRPPSTN